MQTSIAVQCPTAMGVEGNRCGCLFANQNGSTLLGVGRLLIVNSTSGPKNHTSQTCCGSMSGLGGNSYTARKDRPKRTRQQIQDMINADLARRYPSDDEDIEGMDPLYVEEDDPNWLDEPDEGWGYKVSDLFKEDFGVVNRKKHNYDDDDEDAVNDIPEMDWDFQPERFSAADVDSASWTATVFGDPTPLVAIIYERYGKKGRECYHVLRELEDAANRMWEAKRLPPRLVKINASLEEDLVTAIGVKEIPTFLFVKGGKLIHYQAGYLTADELLQIISYFFHGAARPKCLKIPPKEKASVKL